jgi:hypothetical protein
MGKFIKKKLFEVSTGKGSGTTETMWAYSVLTEKVKSTGRYRIRISRMSAAEMIEALGATSTEKYTDIEGHSIQAYLEKWVETGWIPCLDWLGAPSSNNAQIEKDLSDMFMAFVTGNPVELDYFPDFTPPSTYPNKSTIDIDPPVKLPFTTGSESSDIDLDWV